jgi:TM2 domain-containing membrane protein YozV
MRRRHRSGSKQADNQTGDERKRSPEGGMMGGLNLGRQQTRLVQSASAYGAAALITVTLHEFAHGITAYLFGLNPIVYGLHEEDIASATAPAAVIAGAGPVASLVLGLIFLTVHKRLRGQGFGRYLTLWLGLLGIAVFMGYLMTPPFYKNGDVYKVLASLDMASPVFLATSLFLGGIGIVQLARTGLPCLLNLTNSEVALRPQMMASGMLAWVAGSVFVLLATTPQLPLMLVAIGTFVPLMNLFAARRDKTQPYGEPGAEPKISRVGVGLLVVLAVLEQTVLRTGVRL